MLLVHIVLPGELTVTTVPRVSFDDEETLSLRLETAIGVADAASPSRIAVELPGIMWEDAGEGRSAQHSLYYAARRLVHCAVVSSAP